MPDVSSVRTIGSGVSIKVEDGTAGKIRIVVEVDEGAIARAAIPGLLAQLVEKPAEPAKKAKKREPKPGEPGYDSKLTAPIPFDEKKLEAPNVR